MLGYPLNSNNVSLKENNTPRSKEKNHSVITTVKPATEEIIKEYHLISKDEINALVNKSKYAF